MLQLAGGVGLGVDVGDLFELEGALQGHGVVQAAPQEEDVLAIAVLLRQLLDLLLLLQDLLDLFRRLAQRRHDPGCLLRGEGAALPGEQQPQQVHHQHLGGIGLGGGHGDLRSRPGIDHIVGLPGDRTAHHVGHRQHVAAALPGLPQGGQGIRRLARLADDHHQRLRLEQRVAIAKL